jgi:hypothetical protein
LKKNFDQIQEAFIWSPQKSIQWAFL